MRGAGNVELRIVLPMMFVAISSAPIQTCQRMLDRNVYQLTQMSNVRKPKMEKLNNLVYRVDWRRVYRSRYRTVLLYSGGRGAKNKNVQHSFLKREKTVPRQTPNYSRKQRTQEIPTWVVMSSNPIQVPSRAYLASTILISLVNVNCISISVPSRTSSASSSYFSHGRVTPHPTYRGHHRAW